MENPTDLLQQFLAIIWTVDFMWVVVATSIAMEVLKLMGAFPETMKSNKYPLWGLIIAAFFLLLKTAFTGEWREWIANFIFTALMVDIIYTFAGQYIVQGIIWLFKRFTGNLPQPPTT